MRVRSRVFDPNARRRRSRRKSRRRVDDDRRDDDGRKDPPRKAARRSEEEKGQRASAGARGTKAATPCSAVTCRAARANGRRRARPGRAAESLVAGSSAARHFHAAAEIAGRVARENARLRRRMDETQNGSAWSPAPVARLRGGMSDASKTWLKSMKDTRDARKRARVTAHPAAWPHGASVPLGGRRARSNWTPKSWSAPPAVFLSACAAWSRAS